MNTYTRNRMKNSGIFSRVQRVGTVVLCMVLLLGISGCASQISQEELWERAMEDAVISEDDEVYELVCLVDGDENVIWDQEGRVLLVTWHDYQAECEAGDTMDPSLGDIWATSLGEMISWYEDNSSSVDDWELRFSQLLGVHADEGYTRFTAFWISTDVVLRPAYVKDPTAQMINDYSAVGQGQYREWFDENIIWSYFESDYPWTRLGYTYDWSGDGDYGLTEFLVPAGSGGEIEFTYTTEEFVQWLDGQIDE